jgi:hypothetical protein
VAKKRHIVGRSGRAHKELLLWAATPTDYKSIWNGKRSILVLRGGGTTLVPLEELTDAEIDRLSPRPGVTQWAGRSAALLAQEASRTKSGNRLPDE